jgi:hypothetical protein
VTLFEYLVIAYSLILSFAALRLIAGLPHALGVGAAGMASDRPATHRWILIGAALVAVATAFTFLRPGGALVVTRSRRGTPPRAKSRRGGPRANASGR